MVSVVAAVLAALAVLAYPPSPRRSAAARLAATARGGRDEAARKRQDQRPQPPGRSVARRDAAARHGVALLGGIAATVVAADALGVTVALSAGLATTVGLVRALSRLEPASARRRRSRLAADLPAAADLLAACLVTGCPLPEAVEAVSDALGGPLGAELRSASAQMRLGTDPSDAFGVLAAQPVLAPLGRALARAVDSGAPVAHVLVRVADEQRTARRHAASAAAQRVAVWSAAPLGLCFLPAFVLLGVVPLVAGTLPVLTPF